MDVLGKPIDDDSAHDIILFSLHDGFDIVKLTHNDEGSSVTLINLLLNHAEEFLKRRGSECFFCGSWPCHTSGCPHYTPVKIECKELLDVFVVEINLTSTSTWVFDTGCGAHIVNNMQGLRESKKLVKGEVTLRVGNGAKVAALAIGSYHLRLPSGLILVLNNCYYVPTITKNIISVPISDSEGFSFEIRDKCCFISKENMLYANAKLINVNSSRNATVEWCVRKEEQDFTRYGEVHDELY
ncbi:uncharacterized protein LOC110713509 [Chenopodium quinoa]|uniref:uncharacterized protein LOC110713509 n=1 Tax=Chenopodium quinoa TaxID=63459 RepID=UPI000B787B89|nr:uncharacterized protein LOC110713509 [Chenopodium quinoa]